MHMNNSFRPSPLTVPHLATDNHKKRVHWFLQELGLLTRELTFILKISTTPASQPLTASRPVAQASCHRAHHIFSTALFSPNILETFKTVPKTTSVLGTQGEKCMMGTEDQRQGYIPLTSLFKTPKIRFKCCTILLVAHCTRVKFDPKWIALMGVNDFWLTRSFWQQEFGLHRIVLADPKMLNILQVTNDNYKLRRLSLFLSPL